MRAASGLGASSSLTATPEGWRSLASDPTNIGQLVAGCRLHAAVWTGSEMMVPVGYDDGGTFNTGVR